MIQTDTRIKVIHIAGNARIGGVAAFLLNYFRYADTKKFRFDFVTYGRSDFDDAVHEIDSSSKIFYIPSFQKDPLAAMRALKRIYRSDHYAIVHSHMTTLSAFALPPAAKAGIPARICHAHSAFDKNSDHYLIKKLLRPFAAARATALAACSVHAARNLFAKKAETAAIIPNAIPAERFICTETERGKARETLHFLERTVLFVGRFVYQKNLFFLLDAFAKALQSREMTLILVGDGKDKGELLAYARARGIDGHIKFVPPCDPAVYYKAADLFVLPSRYEGLGMVAIEAQAAGVPCLLSDAVPKEADISGACRFLPALSDKDAELWAHAMAEDAPRIQDAAERIEKAGYDIRKEAHLLTDYYKKLLSEKGLWDGQP